MEFYGQAGVVTGAARGIGLEIARELGRLGCRVALADQDREGCERAAEHLRKETGADTVAFVCDVRSKQGNQDLARAAFETFGRLDLWVNNAGILRDNLLIRMSEDEMDQVMDVNFKGAFLGIQAAAKYMLKARRGKIVNIGSVSGLYGNAGQANYSASKAALIALTKTAARELAPRNITVNTVAAGFVENDMTAHLTDEQRATLRNMIPLKVADPPAAYIARATRFLLSADADFITGAVLRVDGGMMIGY